MDSTRSASCITCEKTESDVGEPLKYCDRCKTAKYCSRNCQKADWRQHKQLCGKSPQIRSVMDGNHNPGFHFVNNALGLQNNRHLHGLSEKEAMDQLIDCFRMRAEDEYHFAGNSIGLYNQEDPRHEFRKFMDLAKTRDGILPAWWSTEKREECEKRATTSSNWSDINWKVKKSQISEHYNNSMMPMRLRVLAEKIYCKGVM